MIECNRCHCEISDKLVECCDVNIIENDLTEIDSNADIWRFCQRCWDEMIGYLIENGMLS